MDSRSGDEITSRQGDGGKGTATGKHIKQDITENNPGNIVNNYLDRNNPRPAERGQSITLDERLNRLELADNKKQEEIANLKRAVDGDPAIRFRGLLDQIADSAKSDLLWKQSTEKWIESAEKRFEKIEDKKDVLFTSRAAILYVIIGIMAAIILFLLLTRGQTAGQAMMIDAVAMVLQGGWYV
jgi:hypothetical protein